MFSLAQKSSGRQRTRNSRIRGLTSPGFSWCMKCPVPVIITFSRPSVKNRSMDPLSKASILFGWSLVPC